MARSELGLKARPQLAAELALARALLPGTPTRQNVEQTQGIRRAVTLLYSLSPISSMLGPACRLTCVGAEPTCLCFTSLQAVDKYAPRVDVHYNQSLANNNDNNATLQLVIQKQNEYQNDCVSIVCQPYHSLHLPCAKSGHSFSWHVQGLQRKSVGTLYPWPTVFCRVM